MGITEIVAIVVLILSIVLHEVAHGYAANWLGDPTARLAGRLSPNPFLHIDPVGSVIVPLLLFLTHSPFMFGWAKPVPYNPYNLRNQRWGEAIVAAAGPLTNLLLALIFGGFIRLAVPLGLSDPSIQLAGYIVFINVLLCLFNLIPIPPLDGSKILTAFLPFTWSLKFRDFGLAIERLGFLGSFLVIFVFVSILWAPFSHFVYGFAELIAGIPIS